MRTTINEFRSDYEWQKDVRTRILVPFYRKLILLREIDRFQSTPEDAPIEELRLGDLRLWLPTGRDEDPIMKWVDEKIVRYPGRNYTAVPLEVQSCSLPGRETDGWMVWAQYGWLFHVKAQQKEHVESVIIRRIDFMPTKRWFWANQALIKRMPMHTEPDAGQAKSRVVPYDDIIEAGIDIGPDVHVGPDYPVNKQTAEMLLRARDRGWNDRPRGPLLTRPEMWA